MSELLERLHREHYPALVSLATRRLGGDHGRAEDAVQRAFEQVWRWGRAAAHLTNPAAYLAVAARHEIHRETRAPVYDHQAVDRPHGDASPDVAGRVADRIAVRTALDDLAARERQAVVLRLQWQLSVAETAVAMGVSSGAVKGYTHHGVRKLRERLAPA